MWKPSLFIKAEKTKPKDGPAFVGGVMFSAKWEDATAWLKSKAVQLKNVLRRK